LSCCKYNEVSTKFTSHCHYDTRFRKQQALSSLPQLSFSRSVFVIIDPVGSRKFSPMSSFFSQVWNCCLRNRSTSPGVNEQSQLIPPAQDHPTTMQPTSSVIDHQKLKERLGTIVRSKEGKMINVGTPLPLNLHHKALHARIDPSGSTSSRSGARSLSGSSGQRLNTAGDPGAEREGSTSRASSPHHPSSDSLASLQPGDASYLPPEERDDGKRPILNVRLAGDGTGRTRKGRSRGRLGRFGEERGRDIRQPNGGANGVTQYTEDDGEDHKISLSESPSKK